ncbi:hypothetical protein Vafri_9567 [Volvox africanus]|uniref:MSP domain-containing protein n=1 Tax=Volvox africanus TaxID=51714 RepID=A0A8J4F1M1_9CHLO|nr:hypothetical protein Vafri_9567 [Volvox africanus]
MAAATFVLLEPEELLFRDVKLSQVYSQTLRITNTLRGPVELTVKPGSTDRYTVAPTTLRLKAEETAVVEIRLRVVRFAQRQKAVEQGHRDVFHIKGSHFDQKFYATFWLSPESEQPVKPKPGASAAFNIAQPRIRVQETGSSIHGSPPASPTRIRKAITKSVSFAEPSSACPGSARGADPMASIGAAGSGGHGAASYHSSGDSLGSPPQIHSGLRHALADLQSPKRSAAFNAMESGARYIQRKAMDRANLDSSNSAAAGAVATVATMARLGAQSVPRGSISASIDFGQLAAGAARGGMTHRQESGMPACPVYGRGSITLSLDNLAPRGPPHSLPSSPEPEKAPSLAAAGAAVSIGRVCHLRTDTDSAISQPQVLPRGLWQSASAPVPLGASTVRPHTSSPGRGGKQPQASAAITSTSYQLLPRQEIESQHRGSPGRGSLPGRGVASGACVLSNSRTGTTQQLDTKLATRSHLLPVHVGSSDPKALILELQGGQPPEEGGRRWMEEQSLAEEEQRRFLEDEARAVGLHLTRGSIESLDAEVKRLQAIAKSPVKLDSASSGSPGLAIGLESPTGRPGARPARGTGAQLRPAAMRAGGDGGSQAWQGPETRVSSAQLSSGARAAGAGSSGNFSPAGLDSQSARIQVGTERTRSFVSETELRRWASEEVADGTRRQGHHVGSTTALPRQPCVQESIDDLHPRGSGPREAQSSSLELKLKLQAMERQQASMRRTIEQQQEVLKDKSSLLEVLQDQLKAAQAQLRVQAANRSDSPAAKVAEERSALTRERDSLMTRLADVEADLATSREEASALRRLQLELQSRQPEVTRAVEAAIMREQALQEERNRKALELLVAKDAGIKELEDRVKELLKQNLELQQRVQTAETQVRSLMQAKEALVETAQHDRQHADNIIANLESRLAAGEVLNLELAAAQERAVLAETRVAEMERRLSVVQQRALEAEARENDMDGARRQLLLQRRGEHAATSVTDAHSQQVAELEARIADLMAELSRSKGPTPVPGAAESQKHGMDNPDAPGAKIADTRALTSLEAANTKLDGEVQSLRRQLSASAQATRERAWEQVELDRLRKLVSERNVEVAELTSQVEVLKARLESMAVTVPAAGDGYKTDDATSTARTPSRALRRRASEVLISPTRGRKQQQQQGQQAGRGRSRSQECDERAVLDDVQAAVVERLRKQLAKSEAALRVSQERLSLMEARAAVAQKTAGKGEQELENVQRSMVGSVLEQQRLQQELESARATAARLNSRISDLVQAEQVARAEVDTAKAKLAQLQELHTSETLDLQERLHRLADHMASTQPEVLQVLLGPEYISMMSLPATDAEGSQFQLETGATAGGPDIQRRRHMAGSPETALCRERELEKAVETAETAVAVMQDRLLSALKAAADADEEAARVRGEAEWERDRLEAELRTAREDGTLRIRNLEEAVARLSARGGDAAQAMARSIAEADAASRRETRLRSELGLAQQAAQRANAQAAELRLQLRDCEQALREAHVYGGLLQHVETADAVLQSGRLGRRGGSHNGAASAFTQGLSQEVEERLAQQAMELARRQQVIARLVDVAERAQAEAADLQTELNSLKQAMPDPKQHLHIQYAEVQRHLGATEAELRACRDAKSACELELVRLQQQLAERIREVDAASERLTACEREVAAKEEAATRKAVEVRGAMSKEVALLSRRAAEAQRAADEAEARARELDTQLGNLRAELAEARSELEAQATEVRQVRLKAREEKRAAEEAARQSKRAAELAKQEAQERRAQLAIMMETIEVLQAGNPGEREQRIVSLTAQLSALSTRESVEEQRAQKLLADFEASSSCAEQWQLDVSELRQQVARLEQQLAAAASNRMMLEGELSSLRSDLRTRDAAALRAARELDEREQRVAFLEADVEALRRTLNETQSRHAEQLAREREDAAASLRQARAESSAAAAASSQAARLERFQATLEELVAFVESKIQQRAPSAAIAASTTAADGPEEGAGQVNNAPPTQELSSSSAGSWVISTMERLKALALESERAYMAAATDGRLHLTESRWAWSRVHRLQWALEQRTGEWQVAQARVQQLERALGRRSEEAAVHALEQVALQDKQVSALNERLQATTVKLVVATSQAAGAEAALTAARAAAAALQRQVLMATAERKELTARLAAAEMEAAGSTEAVNLGTEAALAQRDLSIRQYFDAQVASMIAKPDVRDKIMALAREVCALKLSESQLMASLAAAKHRGDASAQLAASLQASLRAADEFLEQVLNQQNGSASGSSGGGGEQGVTSAGGAVLVAAASPSVLSNLGMEVARLTAQSVAHAHEMFQLQEVALRAKQAYERRESDIEELQAQVAASELLLTQARAEGSAALFALREQLTEIHDQDRHLLIQEIRELQERLIATRDLASKDVELAEQRIAEITMAKDAEIAKRVAAALDGQVDSSRLHEMEARATCAEGKVTHLEAQVETLQESLTEAQAQVKELEDLRDVTGAAVASLEATLARIEKQASSCSAAGSSVTGVGGGGGRSGSGALSGGARRVLVTGSSGVQSTSNGLPSYLSPASVMGTAAGAVAAGLVATEQPLQGLAGLSREIMRAKMAEAEAVRKMRAAARSEVDLRQKLLQRDQRISELKEHLAAKTRSLEDLRRRTFPGDGPYGRAAPLVSAFGGSLSSGGAKAVIRGRSPSPSRGGAVPAASTRPAAAAPRRLSAEPSTSDVRPATEGTDAEYLVDQVAQLRVDMAKRQAEIERLQGALAEANAAAVVRVEAPKPPAAPGKLNGQANGSASVDRLKDQLATANAEIAAALSTANGLLVRLQHQGGPISGPVVGAINGARRTSSPAQRTSVPGSLPSPESSLVPGTLSGVMQQLAAALRVVKVGKAASALLTTGQARAADSPVKDGVSSPTKSTATRNDAAAAQTTSGSSPPPPGAVNSSLTDGSSLGVFDELVRLKEDYRDLMQQRDDISFRCSLLEGEVQRCRELMKKLQAAAGKDDIDQRADQLSKLVNAAQLSRVLEESIGALHVLCDRMQTASPLGCHQDATPKADGIYQMLVRLASELNTMGTTVGMLKTELGNVAQDLPKQHNPQQSTATAASTPATSDASYNPSMGGPFHTQGLAGQASSQSIAAQVPSSASLGLGAFATPSSEQTPGACLSWESSASVQVTGEPQQATKPAAEPSGIDPRYERPPLDQNPSGSSVGSRPAGVAKGPPVSTSVSGNVHPDAVKLQSLGDGAALSGLSHAQAVALATTAAKHKARADKWKQRSKELGAQLSLLNASTAAREAAVSERHVASAHQMDEELRAWRAEAARLSAELSGVEAARKELESVHQSSGNEMQALMARIAEAVARAAALQQQLDSERAQAAAERAALQEELAVLKAAVAQEKGERARLLVSLRESHNNAQQAGDSETRFRNEALEAHAAAAAARATAERAEERAEAWRAEADSLRQRLQQAERSRANLVSTLEGRLAAAERRSAECSARTAERVEELSTQLAVAQSEARATPRVLEAKLTELEAQLASVEARSEATLQSARSDVQIGRWDALTRIARYKATIKQLQIDMDGREARWEREKAELQATTNAAVRRSEAITIDLKELKAQTLELQAAVDADRHQLNARHTAQIQDLQRQIDQERRLLTEQALAKAEAAAAASERAAEEAARARLTALEGDFGRRLSQIDSARLELLRELELVQMQFSQYQAQKAAEVAVLEQRIRGYIDNAGAARRGVVGAAVSTGPQSAAQNRSIAAAAVDVTAAAAAATSASTCAPVRRCRAAVHRHSLRRQGGLLLAARRRGRTGDPLESPNVTKPVGAIPPGLAPITSNAGEMGQQVAITPSQLMALARASEALAAAQRETTFERALRGRAEAQAGLLRGAMARLRGKMRAVSEQLAEVRARSISTDEHRQLQTELASCREQLKTARAESARRHKALQALQSIAMAQPSTAAQNLDPSLGGGVPSSTAALQTAANKVARTSRFVTTGALMGLPPRVPSPGAAAAASQGHACSVGVPGQELHQVEPSPQVRELDMNRQVLPFQGGAFAIEEDPLAATLEAAAANARAANAALEVERSARQAGEMKLKEAKAAIERKATLIRDLKRRVEELEVLVQKQAVAANEESNAETRARTLAAALTRKDSIVKELRERLEAAQASLAAGNAAAEAGCEELEVLRRANSRLKAELAKRESSLRTALSDLEKERKQLSGLTRQLELITRREAAARRQVATARAALNRRASALLEALRGISRVLLQAVAAMDAAADRLLQLQQKGETKAALPPLGAAASAPAVPSSRAMSAQDISQLTSLSVEEVRHLLGPEAGELACLLGLQNSQKQRPDGRGTAAASLEAAQRVGELLAVLEASLEATAMVAATAAVERALHEQDTSKDVDEGPSEEEQLRDLLLAAVAEAADPAAAAAAVLNSRVQSGKATDTATIATATATALEAAGSKIPAGRRTNGPSRGSASFAGPIAAHDNAGGGNGSDPWDGQMLQVLVEEIQSEAQRAESELAAALKDAGAL